jgi:hypothetical protein
MAEVEQRIARVRQLLATPPSPDRDDAALEHTLHHLEQLRAEMAFASAG